MKLTIKFSGSKKATKWFKKIMKKNCEGLKCAGIKIRSISLRGQTN